MPKQKPGKSEQSVQAPSDFMQAIGHGWGSPVFDLASDSKNTQAPSFFSEQDDSLKQDWTKLKGVLWLNPPYADIGPWVEKCYKTAKAWDPDLQDRRILVLIPAAVGTNYWHEWVHNKCEVSFLRPRLTFVGHKHPYPKDLVLLNYSSAFWLSGYETWKWK